MELGELGLSKFFQGNKQTYLPRDSPGNDVEDERSSACDGGGQSNSEEGR